MIKSLVDLVQALRDEFVSDPDEVVKRKLYEKIHGIPADGDYGMWNGVPMTDKRDLMKAVMYGQKLKGEGGSDGKIVRVEISSMPNYQVSVTRLTVFVHIDIVTHMHRIVTLGTNFDYDYWAVEDTRKGMTKGYYEFIEMVGRKIDKIDFLADEKRELAKQALLNLAIAERML